MHPVDLGGLVGVRAEAVEPVVGEGELRQGHGSRLGGVHVVRHEGERQGDLVLAVATGLLEHPAEQLAQGVHREVAELADPEAGDAPEPRASGWP